MNPKVVAISRCKNEADIVEAWVRHTLTHVDRLVVEHNSSEDDTGEILANLQLEGLPLTVVDAKVIGDHQAERMNLLKDKVLEDGDVAWIVPLDTDEFVECPGRLADQLLNLSADADVVQMPWVTFVCHGEDEAPTLNPVLRMGHRMKDEGTPYPKVVLSRAAAQRGKLSQGQHYLLEPDGRWTWGSQLSNSHESGPALILGHFPIRDPDQWACKAAIAHLQHTAEGNHGSMNTHPAWQALNADGEISWSMCQTISQQYCYKGDRPDWKPEPIFKPLDYRGGVLQYTKPLKRFNRVLSRYAEKLALAK